jgi:radical SAM protein with 4Fe4S-binding SPASM domain
VEKELLELKLKIPESSVTLQKEDKYLFLIPEKPEWIVTNRNGAIALEKCDGVKTINEIINELDENRREELTGFFRDIVENTRFFHQEENSCNNCRNNTIPPILNDIYIHVTEKCNLNCIYCYVEERQKKSGHVLTLEDCKKIAQDVNSNGIKPRYNITGGEPMLVSWLPEYIEFLRKSGHELILFTNGTLFNEDNIKWYAENCNMIRISLDGSFSYDHDLHRGKDTYKKVKWAIDKLISLGADIMISVTVTKKNKDNLADISKEYGNRVNFAPLFPAGRGREIDELLLTGDEYYYTLFQTRGIEPYGQIAKSLENLRCSRITRCAAGERNISIAENGDVYPCQLLHSPEFIAGNILNESFADIFYNSKALDNFREISVDTIEGCKDCILRYICCGGCFARSYYETGDIRKAGSFCIYEKLALLDGIFSEYYP